MQQISFYCLHSDPYSCLTETWLKFISTEKDIKVWKNIPILVSCKKVGKFLWPSRNNKLYLNETQITVNQHLKWRAQKFKCLYNKYLGSKLLIGIMCLNWNSKGENTLTCLVPNLHHFVQEIDGLIDAGRPGNLLQYIERHGWFVFLKRSFNQHYISSICNMIWLYTLIKEPYSCIIHTLIFQIKFKVN